MGTCYSYDDQDELQVLHKTTALQAYGRYVASMPWGFRSSILNCIRSIEKEKGRPAYLVEIAQKMAKDTYWPVPHIAPVMVATFDLYRGDEVLCDRELSQFSLNPENQSTLQKPTEFELYSDRYVRLYSKYALTKRLLLQPTSATKVVNFCELKKLLLSKDLTRASELDWIDSEGLRFLDRADLGTDKIALQSFPRSGNSFTRKFLESILGLYTGSDMPIDVAMNLQQVGLLGEEWTCDDDLVWITKTHCPAAPYKKRFHASKMIVVVRNPIDVFPSFISLMNLQSHSLRSKQNLKDDLASYWAQTLPILVKYLKANHVKMLDIASQIPTYFIRFEDLITDPLPVLLETMRFMLDVSSIEGTVVEQRAIQKFEGKVQPEPAYKLKTSTSKLNKSYDQYSDEQIELIKQELKDYLYFFGYTAHPLIDHSTPFFTYENQTEGDLENWKGFKTWNDRTLDQAGAGAADVLYHFNSEKSAYEIENVPLCWRELDVATD